MKKRKKEEKKEKKKSRKEKGKKGSQSPKGSIWSAIPDALLCMIVNSSVGGRAAPPKRNKVLQSICGLSWVRPSACVSLF